MTTRNDENIKRLWIDCDCTSPTCAIAITEYLEETEEESLRVSISTHIYPGNLWNRLRNAWHYVIKGKQSYYSGTLLTRKNTNTLIEFLDSVDWSAFINKTKE